MAAQFDRSNVATCNLILAGRKSLSAPCLTPDAISPHTGGMEVRLSPELEAKLNHVVKQSGRALDDLVEDAMAGYLEELTQVRTILDERFDDIQSGRVRPVDGEEFFENLRRKSQERRARS